MLTAGKSPLYVEWIERHNQLDEGAKVMDRPQDKGMQIAKNLKVLEWLKSEILDQVAGLYRHLMHSKREHALDCLASLVVAAFVLARRIGFSFRELDNAVSRKLRDHVREGHQMEEWYGDLSALAEYKDKR